MQLQGQWFSTGGAICYCVAILLLRGVERDRLLLCGLMSGALLKSVKGTQILLSWVLCGRTVSRRHFKAKHMYTNSVEPGKWHSFLHPC